MLCALGVQHNCSVCLNGLEQLYHENVWHRASATKNNKLCKSQRRRGKQRKARARRGSGVGVVGEVKLR